MVIDDGVEDALCVDCEDTVRNPKIAAHLHAHEVGLNDAWLDSKQESRERWFRRKAQGRKQ
jgi:hypothetical protein